MLNIYQFKKHLKYLFLAKHRGGHGVHSPFVFEFICDILEIEFPFYAYFDIDDLRFELENSKKILKVLDYGAGSKRMNSNNRKLSSITKYSSTNAKYGELLFRIVNHYKPKNILEFGTSIGLGTLYLAMPNSKANVSTIEGCPETSKIAIENFKKLKVSNIRLYENKIDEVIKSILNKKTILDFVFFDGNHTKEATINYFEQCLNNINNNSIFVFDDIYWSKEMTEAWNVIKTNKKVRVSIDLFQFGIVFFRKDLSEQHFIIRY